MLSIKNCGLMLEPQEGMSVKEIVEWAKFAESSGYGHFFRSDHLLPTSGKRGLPSPECWASLGILAASTNKIKFGSMVSPIGFRNPALLSRMACTVNSFSNERLVLGVGAGWYEDEYLANGYDFPELRARREQFEESLKIIRPLTEGRKVIFTGKHFSAHTDCLPKPKGKIHLIIGGSGQTIVRLAAEYSDEWNIYSPTLEVYSKMKKVLDERGSSRKIESSQMGPFIVSETRKEMSARVRRYMKSRGMTGDPETRLDKLRKQGVLCGLVEDFVAQIGERIEAGIQKFYFQINDTKDRTMIELLTEKLKAGI